MRFGPDQLVMRLAKMRRTGEDWGQNSSFRVGQGWEFGPWVRGAH